MISTKPITLPIIFKLFNLLINLNLKSPLKTFLKHYSLLFPFARQVGHEWFQVAIAKRIPILRLLIKSDRAGELYTSFGFPAAEDQLLLNYSGLLLGTGPCSIAQQTIWQRNRGTIDIILLFIACI